MNLLALDFSNMGTLEYIVITAAALVAILLILVVITLIVSGRKKSKAKKSAEKASAAKAKTEPVNAQETQKEPEPAPVTEEKPAEPAPVAEPEPVAEKPVKKVTIKAVAKEEKPVKKVTVTAKPAASKPAAPAQPKTAAQTAADDGKRIYHISKRKEDGKWQVKFEGGAKALKLFDTQQEAIDYAKTLVGNNPDASIKLHRVDGGFRKI